MSLVNKKIHFHGRKSLPPGTALRAFEKETEPPAVAVSAGNRCVFCSITCIMMFKAKNGKERKNCVEGLFKKNDVEPFSFTKNVGTVKKSLPANNVVKTSSKGTFCIFEKSLPKGFCGLFEKLFPKNQVENFPLKRFFCPGERISPSSNVEKMSPKGSVDLFVAPNVDDRGFAPGGGCLLYTSPSPRD